MLPFIQVKLVKKTAGYLARTKNTSVSYACCMALSRNASLKQHMKRQHPESCIARSSGKVTPEAIAPAPPVLVDERELL